MGCLGHAAPAGGGKGWARSKRRVRHSGNVLTRTIYCTCVTGFHQRKVQPTSWGDHARLGVSLQGRLCQPWHRSVKLTALQQESKTNAGEHSHTRRITMGEARSMLRPYLVRSVIPAPHLVPPRMMRPPTRRPRCWPRYTPQWPLRRPFPLPVGGGGTWPRSRGP